MKTLSDIERELKQIEQDITAHDEAKAKLSASKQSLMKELAVVKYGIAPGSLVTYRNEVYEIVGPDLRYWFDGQDRPWVIARPKKKDGTFSKVERNLYSDWTLTTPNP